MNKEKEVCASDSNKGGYLFTDGLKAKFLRLIFQSLKDQGMSPKDMATLFKVNQFTISSWIKGSKYPSTSVGARYPNTSNMVFLYKKAEELLKDEESYLVNITLKKIKNRISLLEEAKCILDQFNLNHY